MEKQRQENETEERKGDTKREGNMREREAMKVSEND